MPIPRFAARRDSNEAAIIEALTRAGASVVPLSAKGVPDLLIGYQSVTVLAEIKTAKGKLTPDQEQFLQDWRGNNVFVLRSVEDALDMLNQVRELL